MGVGDSHLVFRGTLFCRIAHVYNPTITMSETSGAHTWVVRTVTIGDAFAHGPPEPPKPQNLLAPEGLLMFYLMDLVTPHSMIITLQLSYDHFRVLIWAIGATRNILSVLATHEEIAFFGQSNVGKSSLLNFLRLILFLRYPGAYRDR